MKYTYIKKSYPGYYMTLDYLLSEDLIGNIGTTFEDFLNGYYVLLSEEQIAFHSNYPKATIGEVFNLEIPIVPEISIGKTKEKIKSKATNYRWGIDVNCFHLDGVEQDYDIDQDRLNNEIITYFVGSELNNNKITLHFDDDAYEVPTKTAGHFLLHLKEYFDACSLVLDHHLLAIEQLENKEDVENYDYTTNYPSIPTFSLHNEEPQED